ncbi:hypothetical protein RLEG12_18165 [Rhizobium leguminosarum bv. trifolii CB782]|nr:hypothetical protein RLEG12_18165 [Rhizobium leguminosarum bv. trifolii CB782]
MRKSVSLISMLLAFFAMAGEAHAAISYQRLDGATALLMLPMLAMPRRSI